MTGFYHAEIINSQPAKSWLEAQPIGNGRLGAMIYGNIYEEKILLNHEYLYVGAKNRELPDLSGQLPQLRRLMAEGRYREANELYPTLLKKAGYFAETGRYYPAFDVNIVTDLCGAFYDYSRTLDLERAECVVRWKDSGRRFFRKSFVSRGEIDALVTTFRAEDGEKVSCSVSLSPHDIADARAPGGGRISPQNLFRKRAEGNFFEIRTVIEGTREAAAVLAVFARNGSVRAVSGEGEFHHPNMTGTAEHGDCLVVTDADEILVLCDVFVGDHLDEQIENAKRRFSESSFSAETDPYCRLSDENAALHGDLFQRMRIDLGGEEKERKKSNEQLLLDSYQGKVSNAVIERMFDYGRYLLICSSRKDGLPANLQGIWNGDYEPAWNCTFFNNENIQMCYWQAFSCNLAETALPLFRLFDRRMDDFRENAKKLFGCRGILLPLFMDAECGIKKNLQSHVVYWTAGAAWIASIYFDYYLYTGDEKFLREQAYPFLREAALFYEDFTYDTENGLKFCPSVSPENFPLGDFEGSGLLNISEDATMDYMCLKELLTNLIRCCEILKIDEPDISVWKSMLAKIPPYHINRDGAIAEWMSPVFQDNYRHRHLSHLYALFPGREVNRQTPELFEACRVAVEKRLCIGLKEQTGWSLAHMANVYARLGEGDRLLECLHLIVRSCTGSNFLTYHNDWRNQGVTLRYLWADHAPFQIDANMGVSAAVAEMLVNSSPEEIDVLPALPSSLDKVCVQGLRCRGGIELDLALEEKILALRLRSKGKKKVLLRFPFAIAIRQISDSSKWRTLDSRCGEVELTDCCDAEFQIYEFAEGDERTVC